jgi:copper chaperone NosL
MSTPKLVFIALALLASSCSARAAGRPEIAIDKTACSHCGMLVSEPAYAAAYHVPDKEPRVFDDIGCMIDAIRQETVSPTIVWFQDAGGRGWIDADQAVFVTAPSIRTPMNGGVLAYAEASAAQAAAEKYDGRMMRSWPELIAWNGDAK